MTVKEARELLGLDVKASREEIRSAYRRTALRWHPDCAPQGQEAEYRVRMQQVNEAYHRILQLLENYRYDLVENEEPEDLQQWWASRFYTGVWGPPPPAKAEGEDG